MKRGIRGMSGMPFTLERYEQTVIWAVGAQRNAYAPYSKFQVGAALLFADGMIHSGCNVETANYDGTHAEESALASMATAGRRDPILCVCVGALKGEPPVIVMPCGKCRQALHEFRSLSGREIWVALDSEAGPKRKTGNWFMDVSDLLPHSFGPADIGVDLKKYRR